VNQKERAEKLSKRNPDRLQQKVDDLRSLVESGHARPHDRKALSDLEKELSAVQKARASLGIEEKGRKRARTDDSKQDNPNRIKIKRDGSGDESDSGDSTSSSVREIPLPPGPLPPVPGEAPPPKPETKTTYESAPVMRDLRKEAAAFVPAAVKRKMEQEKAQKSLEHDEEDVEQGGNGGAASVGILINAAPDVDVDREMSRFHAEIEAVEDDET